tara:strand:- start:1029 stop:1658 length:630 start_codon:yes stop_codon:yes gene_type:complete
MASDLQKKLQLKQESKLLILNASPSEVILFSGLDVMTEPELDTNFDTLIVFIETAEGISEWLPKIELHSTPTTTNWLAYPKRAGSIPTELNRDSTAEQLANWGYESIRLISLNADWSVFRIIHKDLRKKPSTFGQDPPGVNRKTKTVEPPNDLLVELEMNPKAATFFDKLAFSHKREYVRWIHDAKKPETRLRRIKKTIELLLSNKKTK